MPDVKVDLISNGRAQGEMANALQMGGLNVGTMRPYIGRDGNSYITIYKGGPVNKPSSWQQQRINNNASLRKEEWMQYDAALLEVSRQRLGGIQDLIDKGLTYNLGNAMGTTVLEWEDINDSLEAQVTMDGVHRGKNDQPNYQSNMLPIPIISADYEINARKLAASRGLGNPMDTTLAERAAQRVNEKLEDMLFTNETFGFGEKDDRNRNKIYSYLNFPDRNAVHLSIPWDDSAITPAGIVQDVSDMKAAAMDALHFGPYMLYIPTNYERILDNDYDVSGSSMMTIRERILKLDKIQGIKVIDRMPADNVLLVQMTSDVVRLVRGMGLQNVQWSVEGQFLNKYKVFTIQVPQIRSDQSGKCGIVHLA